MSSNFLIDFLTGLIPLILSLSVHEFAHAWSAYRLGDDTAARMGRLTLNPVAHVDPFGTILLPMALAYMHLPAFGWAKPVPIDPSRFRRDVRLGTGMAITASAGPVSNVILAVVATIGLGLLARFAPELLHANRGVYVLLLSVIQINVFLALFNLIPVPPLDGSRIVDGFMPLRFRQQWEAVVRFAPFLLIGVFLYGGRLISGPANYVFGLLEQLLSVIARA